MSFIFSRALVEASLPASFSDIVASAQSSESPTLKPSLWLEKTTEPSRLFRSGMTFAHLTDGLGEELLTSWLAGFHAKTSARRVQAKVSTESEAGSGRKWLASFARYDHDSSSWKTAQCSLLGDSDEFSETWPRWGSMRNGESYLRQIPALPICESGSGLWPTPQAHDAQKGYADRVGRFGTTHGGRNLNDEVKMWPTPNARDWKGAPGKGCMERGGRQSSLPAAIKMWPTPCASASKGSSPAALTRKDGRDRSNDRIDHAVMASDGGQLNPEWVEWLMGWPIGHTALKPLETDKYREWLQQHSPYSQTNDMEAA
ncbi:MAG TPA: hypothetical protein VF783_14030 [Terriglobales bacterium]